METKQKYYIYQDTKKNILKKIRENKFKDINKKEIEETTGCDGVGSYSYDSPAFGDKKTKNHKNIFKKSFASPIGEFNKRHKLTENDIKNIFIQPIVEKYLREFDDIEEMARARSYSINSDNEVSGTVRPGNYRSMKELMERIWIFYNYIKNPGKIIGANVNPRTYRGMSYERAWEDLERRADEKKQPQLVAHVNLILNNWEDEFEEDEHELLNWYKEVKKNTDLLAGNVKEDEHKENSKQLTDLERKKYHLALRLTDIKAALSIEGTGYEDEDAKTEIEKLRKEANDIRTELSNLGAKSGSHYYAYDAYAKRRGYENRMGDIKQRANIAIAHIKHKLKKLEKLNYPGVKNDIKELTRKMSELLTSPEQYFSNISKIDTESIIKNMKTPQNGNDENNNISKIHSLFMNSLVDTFYAPSKYKNAKMKDLFSDKDIAKYIKKILEYMKEGDTEKEAVESAVIDASMTLH